MKIAFLTSEYPHAKTGFSGGIGTSIKNLANGLIDAGNEVRILVYGQPIDAVFVDKNIVIHQIKNIKIKGLSWYLTRKKIQRIINQLHSNQEIDIVEAPDWTGITSFIKPEKCPIVIKLHGSDTYFCSLENRPIKWSNKFHEKRALQNADGHISVSRFTANKTNELFKQNFEYQIIHNGINSNKHKVESELNSSKIILNFGTLIRKKGLLELPFIFNEVIKKEPSARLYLVGKDACDITSGNSSTWQMMQNLFSPEALKNVNYFGAVTHQQINNYIKDATVCVFPTFAEAFPVSWLEAMALKKPIVASTIGWASEVITDAKDGFLVHPTNHEAYATKIIAVLNDLDLQHKIGEEARKKIEALFDINLIAKQNRDFYDSIISLKESNKKA